MLIIQLTFLSSKTIEGIFYAKPKTEYIVLFSVDIYRVPLKTYVQLYYYVWLLSLQNNDCRLVLYARRTVRGLVILQMIHSSPLFFSALKTSTWQVYEANFLMMILSTVRKSDISHICIVSHDKYGLIAAITRPCFYFVFFIVLDGQ